MSDALLVIKFGGTSLGTPARVRRAARRVRAHLLRGCRVVAVVSANGHATDRIVARLAAVSANGRPHPREADRALATGEELSAALLASALAGLGIHARSLRGGEAGIVAEGGFCGGQVKRVDPQPVWDLLHAGCVPVVAGFQAERWDGETVTLGRGGSDTSAVVLAAALGAPCHIVTDVDAVFDRDPREDPSARPFAVLTHDELARRATRGARVVHPEAAELAARHRVPLCVYHFRAPVSGDSGTRVVSIDAIDVRSILAAPDAPEVVA